VAGEDNLPALAEIVSGLLTRYATQPITLTHSSC
jgi:hypothetical protein